MTVKVVCDRQSSFGRMPSLEHLKDNVVLMQFNKGDHQKGR